jgi:hypothetical protein
MDWERRTGEEDVVSELRRPPGAHPTASITLAGICRRASS